MITQCSICDEIIRNDHDIATFKEISHGLCNTCAHAVQDDQINGIPRYMHFDSNNGFSRCYVRLSTVLDHAYLTKLKTYWDTWYIN